MFQAICFSPVFSFSFLRSLMSWCLLLEKANTDCNFLSYRGLSFNSTEWNKKKNSFQINSNPSVTFSQYTSLNTYYNTYGFPRWLLPMQEVGSIPGSGWFPGGGHGNPLQYFCLESPMDRAAWQPTVHGVQRVRHNQRDLVYIDIIHIDGLNLAYWTDTNPADWKEFAFIL